MIKQPEVSHPAHNSLSLRPLEDQDIEAVAQWLEAPHVRKWFERPWSWLEEIRERNTSFTWIQHRIAVLNDAAIGFCQYYDCSQCKVDAPWQDEPPGTYGIDFLIGDPGYLGQGYGTEVIRLVSREASRVPGAIKLIADPEPGNALSIRALEKNGFMLDTATGLYTKHVHFEHVRLLTNLS